MMIYKYYMFLHSPYQRSKERKLNPLGTEFQNKFKFMTVNKS